MIANELRSGTTIRHSDGRIYEIMEYLHTKPGKGGAYVRVKMRSLTDGKIIDYTFRAEEKVEHAFIERKKMEYLYRDANTFVFMDSRTYDQIEVPLERLQQEVPFLIENETYELLIFEGEVVSISLPESVVLEVVETDPGEKGDTATGGTKPAKLSNGLVIKVPLFVKVGDRVKVDTRSMTYIERAK